MTSVYFRLQLPRSGAPPCAVSPPPSLRYWRMLSMWCGTQMVIKKFLEEPSPLNVYQYSTQVCAPPTPRALALPPPPPPSPGCPTLPQGRFMGL